MVQQVIMIFFLFFCVPKPQGDDDSFTGNHSKQIYDYVYFNIMVADKDTRHEG